MPDTPDKKAAHTLDDHVYGIDLAHTHDGYADHDHDFPDEIPLEENPIWIQDHVTLNSVGIDIGSSGTQIIFSRINLRRLGEDLSSRYFVVSRETLFQSAGRAHALSQRGAYRRGAARRRSSTTPMTTAGIDPDDIDTGAVILTGEALRRENAKAIAAIIAEKGGEFVCATAGHHMEAMLAAYGSGAAAAFRAPKASASSTSISAAAPPSSAWSRTARWSRPRRCMSAGACRWSTRAAASSGSIRPGKYHAQARRLCLGPRRRRDRARTSTASPKAWRTRSSRRWRRGRCRTTSPISISPTRSPISAPIDGIMFSGGVGEYVYGREDRDFGDLGRRLGRAIRRRIDAGALPWPLLPAGECIRATALGASEYSVQLSGNTSYISTSRRAAAAAQSAGAAARLCLRRGASTRTRVAAAIRRHLVAFDVDDDREIALALRWQGLPAYERLAAFAEGIRRGLAEPHCRRPADLHHAGRRRRPDARRASCARSSASRATSWSSTASC